MPVLPTNTTVHGNKCKSCDLFSASCIHRLLNIVPKGGKSLYFALN